MLDAVSGIDATTERVNRSADLRRSVTDHAREFGEESLRVTDKVRLAYWNAFQHDCLTTAKATAYSAIFAVFPMLGLMAALVTLLPGSAPLRYQLALFMNRVLPVTVAPLFQNYFITAHSTPKSASVLLGAALISVYGAGGVMGTLMEGFRRAYGLTEECWGPGWRGGVRKLVQSYVLVPIALVPLAAASALVIFGHVLLTAVMHVSPRGWDAGLYWTANAIRWVSSLSATAAVLAFIYRFAVPVRPAWRRVLPGAAFATATWFLTTLGFGFYVTRYADYSRVYGSLGTGVVLLIWLFLTSLMVLCGAELNAELGRDAVRVLPSRGSDGKTAAR